MKEKLKLMCQIVVTDLPTAKVLTLLHCFAHSPNMSQGLVAVVVMLRTLASVKEVSCVECTIPTRTDLAQLAQWSVRPLSFWR